MKKVIQKFSYKKFYKKIKENHINNLSKNDLKRELRDTKNKIAPFMGILWFIWLLGNATIEINQELWKLNHV